MLSADGFDGELDLGRMRRERYARLQEQMRAHGVGAMLLLGSSNVAYATGALTLTSEPERASYERIAAVVVAGQDAPHLFTPYPEGAPPGARVEQPLYPDLDEGIDDLMRRVYDAIGGRPAGTLAVDECPAALWAELPARLGDGEIADAGSIIRAAKLVKTADEIECIRRAQHINEISMYDVQAALVPGVRQSDLTGIFLARILEEGATANHIDPIWQVIPPRIADLPWTTHGDVAFPLVSSGRVLDEDDVIWVDTGIQYHGYQSDFGRTWVVGDPPRVRRSQKDQCRRWLEVLQAVLAVTKPGATGRDLTRAAIDANGGRTPWPAHFYLAHGVGIDSAEAPLIGTDLGDAFDESIVLAPGMVLVFEPMIWWEGTGGYRSEDIVAVTDDGYRMLSDYPYAPLA